MRGESAKAGPGIVMIQQACEVSEDSPLVPKLDD